MSQQDASVYTQTRLWQDTVELRAMCTAAGWDWRMVGGVVRNLVRGWPVHEVDIEVVGVDLSEVAQVFHAYDARIVGSDKLIVRMRMGDVQVDISTTPHHDIATAAQDRDVTMNAMALLPDGALVDPCGGYEDAQNSVLRHINDKFGRDPIRILRLMRLAAEYDFVVDPATIALMQRLSAQSLDLTADRVWHEWRLWALAPYPRTGLTVLAESGAICWYPALQALQDCAQDAVHHPEGDVWVHTGHVCAAAAQYHAVFDGEERIVLMLSALCHDLGKPLTSEFVDGRIVSPGHAAAGVPLAEQFLASIHAPQRYVAPVANLVREHMVALGSLATPRSVRRLAQRLAPTHIELWGALTHADSAGRPPLPATHPGAEFVALARALHVETHMPSALVRGTDVLAMGVAAGPAVGRYLTMAYEAQLDGIFTSATEGIAWLRTQMMSATGEE